MPDLGVAVVEQYTRGRLDQQDAETARLLAAALASARRYCGWHVTPVLTGDVQTIDGPGSSLLVLPTLRLTELTAVVEDGVELDVDMLDVSPRGLVRKKLGSWWPSPWGIGWTPNLGGVVVTMTHGFADAPDFDAAVLSAIDRISLDVGGGRSAVGPFQYAGGSAGVAFTEYERNVLDSYRLERSP
jgi:hypothetical protein